jgi:hypothetical protein
VVSSCEHGNEPSNSMKGGQFLDQLSDCQLHDASCSMESVDGSHVETNAVSVPMRVSSNVIIIKLTK